MVIETKLMIKNEGAECFLGRENFVDGEEETALKEEIEPGSYIAQRLTVKRRTPLSWTT